MNNDDTEIHNSESIKDNSENIKDKSKTVSVLRYISGTVLFVILSLVEFAVLEIFFKKIFWSFKPEIIIKNTALIALVNLILVSLFQRMKPAFIISSTAFTIIGAANYFVKAFRGYGIVFMDLYAVKTAATVAGGYKYSIDRYFIIGIIAWLIMLLICFFMPKRNKKYLNKKSNILSVAGIIISVLFIVWINTDATFFRNVSSLYWDHNIGITEYGYPLYFIANAGESKVDEPEGYSAEKVDEILSKYYDEEKDKKAEVKSPNVIMIMDEAFSDLSVLGDFTTDKEVKPFFDSLKENTIKGYAESSVYGGYTSNSEFEFLTGCSKVFLPGNPYLQYVDDYLPSVITSIKEQGDYGDILAMHPYNGSGYNRNRVYPLLQFDKFITKDDFKNPHKVRDLISDKADFEKIIELYENKKDDKSFCMFNVTMQNHNPYDYSGKCNFDNFITVNSCFVSSQVNQYLSLIRSTDDALKELITYFQNVEEPTVIVMFGDHQPHLPDIFYKDIMGKEPAFFNQEESMKTHLVPFMIWANYDMKSQNTDIERTSLNYLSSIMLDATGMKMSAYNRYLLELSKELPSVSATGCYDKDGNLFSAEDAPEKYKKLLNEYEMVQYNYLFDKKGRRDKYYNVN